jgi:hypothetical protein
LGAPSNAIVKGAAIRKLIQKTRNNDVRIKCFMADFFERGKKRRGRIASLEAPKLRRFGLRFSNEQGGSRRRSLGRPSC